MPQDAAIQTDFRSAMRRVASGVAIVTTSAGEDLRGITVTSFCSVSLDPPTLLVCVNQRAGSHDHFAQGTHFCLNVLAEEHAHLADLFAGRGNPVAPESRFVASGASWSKGPGGVPVLTRALTAIMCRNEQVMPVGTHSVLFGHVEHVACRTEAGYPLVYSDGAYRNLLPCEWMPSIV